MDTSETARQERLAAVYRGYDELTDAQAVVDRLAKLLTQYEIAVVQGLSGAELDSLSSVERSLLKLYPEHAEAAGIGA